MVANRSPLALGESLIYIPGSHERLQAFARPAWLVTSARGGALRRPRCRRGRDGGRADGRRSARRARDGFSEANVFDIGTKGDRREKGWPDASGSN